MTPARPAIATIAAAAALLALPGPAGAEYLVPPSNSAATQYTETVPTSRGQRDAERERERERSAAEVIGKRNAERLRAQGESGERVAEIVVETAPEPAVAEVVDESSDGGSAESTRKAKPKPGSGEAQRGRDRGEDEAGAAALTGGAGGGNPGPPGSSGAGAILAEATGLAGSQSLWLPLAIVLTAAWALLYAARQRQNAGA